MLPTIRTAGGPDGILSKSPRQEALELLAVTGYISPILSPKSPRSAPYIMSKDQGIQISFDEECRIRVLDPEQFKHSETLEEECRGFGEKIGEFNKSVNHIVNLLQENGARIDKEKLRAIGDRNKVVIYYSCKCCCISHPALCFRHQPVSIWIFTIL